MSLGFALAAVALFLAACVALPAQAANKAKLAEIGLPSNGAGAGQLNRPQGIAVNLTGAGEADPGDFYVADRLNHRISQFTASGAFIRAFGYGVVTAGPDNVSPISAVQSLNVPGSVTGGTFTLSFNGQTTGGSGTGNLVEGTNTINGLLSAKGTGTLALNSPTITGLTTSVGKFIVGQPILGTGIPPSTTIINVSATTLTLSANATAAGSGVELTSGGPRPFAAGQTISGAGIPAGTTITGASAGSLTLSANVEAGGTANGVALKSGLAFNSTSAQVQSALLGLSTIGAGNVAVTGAAFPYSVTFAGALKELPVPLLSADSTNLTGGSASVSQTTAGVSPLEVCKAGIDTCGIGTSSNAAGAVNNSMAVAIDQSNGNVYVNGNPNQRVDVFSADGKFQGAFGVGVRQGDSAPFGLDFCTAATGCIPGQNSAVAGALANNGTSRTMTVDSAGNLYVPNPGNLRLDVFSPTLNGSNEVVGMSFVRGIGWDVIPSGKPGDTGAGLEVCTVASTCQAGSAGGGAGQFPASSLSGVAVDSSGAIYTVNFRTNAGGNCEVAFPCRVQKFNSDGTIANASFGPVSGECQVSYTSGLAVDRQPLAVAVDPSNQHVFVFKKTAAGGARVCEFDSAGQEVDISPLASLTVEALATAGPGLAVGTSGRLYAANREPAAYILGPVPPPVAEILPASAVGSSTATLNGKVTVPSPGGQGFEVKYHFEYSGDNGFHWKSVPLIEASTPSAAGIHSVSQPVTGLEPNQNYLVRLLAATSTTVTSSTAQFTTSAAKPTIDGSEALPVAGTTATLSARVNPNNSPTTYHFQWGPCATPAACGSSPFPNQAPGFDPFAGSGGQPLRVSAALSGLALAATYHFRLVATNAIGTSIGSEAVFTTNDFEGLNDQGLPNRRYELASPADKRPQGAVQTGAEKQAFQAGAAGSFAYTIEGGLSDSTAGGLLAYLATRGPAAWSSTQLSAPSLVTGPAYYEAVWPSTVNYMSDDLSCILLETPNPLTPDTPAAGVELGVTNFYRRNDDGSHTLISNVVPPNAAEAQSVTGTPGTIYKVAGASADCKRIFFETGYKLLPGAVSGLYEWQQVGAGGVLRDAGLLPDGSVPPSSAFFGAASIKESDFSRLGAITPGGRAFFSALSNEPEDSGKLAVFMRRTDGSVVNLSKPLTAVAVEGARYEAASPNGAHVFFAGSYGRTAASSNGPIQECVSPVGTGSACDLYDYDVNAETLTDLTATTDPGNTKGAAVEGVVAVDQDGSHVYFAALGQLVAGKGRTYVENTAGEGSVNIYLASGGALTYVTTLSRTDLARGSDVASPEVGAAGGGNLLRVKSKWTAQTTTDGSQLLFTTRADITGYDSGGAIEAYLYFAGSGRTVCVSCRPDGAPSVASAIAEPLRSALSVLQRNYTSVRSLSADGSRVFFETPDALAPGATEGQRNLYEWNRGTVHWLATLSGGQSLFMGASADGSDVFITTQSQLDPRDTDFVRDLYDIRLGGGFPPPAPAAVPCDIAADQCQGPVTPAPSFSSPSSQGFSGPGNPAVETKQLKKKHKKKKHGKHKKSHKRHAHAKRANHDRGGAK